MGKYIKVFTGSSVLSVQNSINLWLKECDASVVNVNTVYDNEEKIYLFTLLLDKNPY